VSLLANYYVELESQLQRLLPGSRLKRTSLGKQGLTLCLIDPEGMDVALNEAETNAVFDNPPYWSFCWGSGLALAERLLSGAQQLDGKTVVDFGCGSGVVAIAAALAGAGHVTACDLDPFALKASALNGAVNGVELAFLDDIKCLDKPVDILFAADVLYDPENMPLIQLFRKIAKEVVIADSRVKDFSAEGFSLIGQTRAVTEPDLGELESVKLIRFYGSAGC